MLRTALIVVVACLLSVSCTPPPAGVDTIRIGATMSETGAYATQGIPARDGYRLCERDVNAAGGVLGRPIEFVIHDDESNTDRAIELYERLITEENVDLVMGPYGSTLTEAVAPVTERHRMVHVTPLAATSSIWEQGREYLFMILPPAELFLAGLIDMASERGLSRVAVISEDALFPRAAASGAAERATSMGLEVVANEIYASGDPNFAEFLTDIDRADVEVLAMAASSLSDFISMVRQMREMNVDLQMFGTSGAVAEFQAELGADAEYAYGLSAWEPSLPHPGIGEFVSGYQEAFGREPSFHAAGAYGSCRLFADAIEQAGSLDQDAIREQLLTMETTTVFGPYAVDERGYQIANQGVFIQWQDGRKVVVWPEDVATHQPRFPTPAWDDR
jgi:branched-chain amino acid transport system substrate-binding protein